jgi:hypothetical protein
VLYDQYGKPIRVIGPTPLGSKAPKRSLGRLIQRPLRWFRSLSKPTRIAIGGLGLVATALGLFQAVFFFRQEIAVDPSTTYDSKEAFQQQFTITNNGPFDVYGLRYTCAVSSIRLKDGSPGGFPDYTNGYRVIYVMFPVRKPFLKVFRWKERTSTDCDFITRFGPQLESANIEIDLTYRRWMGYADIETIGGRFTGRRDVSGNFQWVYGSNSPSPMETPNEKSTLVVIPF